MSWGVAGAVGTALAVAPLNFTSVSQTALSIVLSWSAPAGSAVVGYELQRAPDQNGIPANPVFLKRATDAAPLSAAAYVDETVLSDTTYHYRVRGYYSGFDGSESSTLKSDWTDYLKVKTLAAPPAPTVTTLVRPGTSSATIVYELLTAGHVDIRVYTIDGVLVNALVDADQAANVRTTLTWDLKNAQGTRVASGTYLVYLKTPDQSVTKKIVIIR